MLVGLLALGGCAGATANPRATVRDVDALRATVRSVYEAVARRDESQYRRLVRIAPGDAYSDALTATMFASIRLHQAVEERIEEQSPPTKPRASLAAVDYRVNARGMIAEVDGWTFTIDGDRATIDQITDRPGSPTLRHMNGRWVLAPAQWETPRDTATYRLAVAEERSLAKALSTARAAVMNGEARSVEDVNAILRELLTEQTTKQGMNP